MFCLYISNHSDLCLDAATVEIRVNSTTYIFLLATVFAFHLSGEKPNGIHQFSLSLLTCSSVRQQLRVTGERKESEKKRKGEDRKVKGKRKGKKCDKEEVKRGNNYTGKEGEGKKT